MFARPEVIFWEKVCSEMKVITLSRVLQSSSYEGFICEQPALFSARFLFGQRSAFPQMPHLRWKRAGVDIFAPGSPLEPTSRPATGARNRSSRGRRPFSPEVSTY